MVALGVARLWAWTAERACGPPACTSSPTAAGARALERALRGGVDLVQLRDKDAADDELLGRRRVRARALRAAGALFLLNDRPDLAAAGGADGVHVGQDDMPVGRARERVGADAIVGLSTHAVRRPGAAAARGVDYIAVGPVHATPTKPGRPAIGLDRRYAAAHVAVPWFAIGGLDADTVGAVVEAGARRIVVVRAITEADDPEAAARALRAARRREARAWAGVAARRRPEPGAGERMRRGYARAEERNAAVRAELEPLAPGERPRRARRRGRRWPALLGGRQRGRLGGRPRRRGRAARRVRRRSLFAASCSLAAVGMWQRRYWAVLGFEALLGITLCIVALCRCSSPRTSPPSCCASRSSARAGWLFWKLIRAMGRLQARSAVVRFRRPWLTPSTTASSSARVRAATSPRSAPPSSA